MIQRFQAPYKSVCVKVCPQFDYNAIRHPVSSPEYEGPLYYNEFQAEKAGASHTHNKKFEEQEAFGYDEGFANGHFTKVEFDEYLANFKVYCLPNNEYSDCKLKEGDFYIYDSYDILGAACVPLAPKAALRFNKISVKFNHGVFGDLM